MLRGFGARRSASIAPASEAELMEIIAAASRERIPITIGGARTGLTGGCVPQGRLGGLARKIPAA